MVEGSISEKTNQCCQNLEAVLKEAGSSITKVVKCNIFLSSMDHFAVRFHLSRFVVCPQPMK